jgi:hypothetical protein
MFVVKGTTVRRTKRTDHIILLKQRYTGSLDTRKMYNAAFANVLRILADRIEAVENAWVDPEVVVWMHMPGRISAEVRLSAPK